MRDVIFSLLILGMVPACFRRPFIGLVMFSWLAYMRTQDLCWGFARHQRWSFLIAMVTFAGFLSHRQEKFFHKDIRTWVMLALVAQIGLSILMGKETSENQFSRFVEYSKIVGIALFTTAVVIKKEHLRVLVWVIALSFGFYGVKIGIAGVLTLGRLEVRQGPGGMLEDNNDFSLALNMALPLLLQIGLAEKNKVLRRGLLLMVPLTALTVILTHSRGGFLGLVAVVCVLIWRSRNRLAGLGLGLLSLIVAALFVPASYVDRIASIKDYEQDGSSLGRLEAWKTAINMALDNPVTGVGMTHFQRNYFKYKPPQSYRHGDTGRVTHNAYLQIWAECGTPALAMYLFLIAATLWYLWRLRRDALKHYYTSWIINYCTMFETSMVAFVVGSTFLNRAHFDLFYHLVAIVVAFEVIARREMAHLDPVLERRGPGGSRLVPVRKTGFRRAALPSGFEPKPALGGRS